jgi:uncharacterized protein (TIGR04255 family)
MLRLTPTYATPPLSEVVCGLVFKKLSRFAIPHVGLLWQDYQPEFSLFKEMPPIEDPSEVNPLGKPIVEEVDSFPMPRFWFIRPEDETVIQVQTDRFFYNWKKGSSQRTYPRFEQVYKGFETEFAKFDKFITETGLGTVDCTEYELTYVNTVSPRNGLENFTQVAKIIPKLAPMFDPNSKLQPSALRTQANFDLMHICGGQGHIDIKPFINSSDSQAGLILSLTVKGFDEDKSPNARTAWYQRAREWISSSFTELTSEEIQSKFWGKE